MNTVNWAQYSAQSAWEIKAYSMFSWRKNSDVNVTKIHAMVLFELKERKVFHYMALNAKIWRENTEVATWKRWIFTF